MVSPVGKVHVDECPLSRRWRNFVLVAVHFSMGIGHVFHLYEPFGNVIGSHRVDFHYVVVLLSALYLGLDVGPLSKRFAGMRCSGGVSLSYCSFSTAVCSSVLTAVMFASVSSFVFTQKASTSFMKFFEYSSSFEYQFCRKASS